jgi:hypothetical protein
MALQILIHHHNQPVTYDVHRQESDAYILRLNSGRCTINGEFIPDKIVMRRKGKIWVSDADNYGELVQMITQEISRLNAETITER